MKGNKKPFTGAQSKNGLSNISDTNHIRVPSEKEIITSYVEAKAFFVEREKWHLEAADWYKSHSGYCLKREDIHRELAKTASAEAVDYWELAFDARLAIVKREVGHG